jgi:CDP-glucose 4,6-dehydratase
MSFWANRNVFVTGATGFLGRWLTEELLERKANVVALVRDTVATAPFFVDGIANRITSVRGALEDYPLLERALNEYEIDTVFHLGAQAIVGVANRNPLATFETNIQGTWNILEACRRLSRVSRIVVASSDKAYGTHEVLPYTEDTPLCGSHPYDVSKSCADLIALSYHHTFGTPVCVTRCGNLFGPGDLNFSRIVPGTIRSVLQNERPIIRSDGTMIRDYVHVREIALAYLLLAERMDDRALHGMAFNFGTGEPQSVLEITRAILAQSRREDLEPVILNEVKAEIPVQYLSSDRARSLLNWTPQQPLAHHLRDTIQWYRNYLPRMEQRSMAQ